MKRLPIYIALTLLVVAAFSGCSTKKNTASSRFWQSFVTRYNVYYNGSEAYKEGCLAKEQGNKDNYTEMLPYFLVGNEKSRDLGKSNFETAITKCEKAIQLHSIKKKPVVNPSKRRSPKMKAYLSRQEFNPFTFGIAKASALIRGEDDQNMQFGDTLSADKFGGFRFDYCISNPPFGDPWNPQAQAVEKEHKSAGGGRFPVKKLPAKGDGQMLFTLNGLSKLKDGGVMAIVQDASPLYKGKPESGEDCVRRYILENDWLDAIVQLPTDSFYNTGIATYIWLLSKGKPDERIRIRKDKYAPVQGILVRRPESDAGQTPEQGEGVGGGNMGAAGQNSETAGASGGGAGSGLVIALPHARFRFYFGAGTRGCNMRAGAQYK